MISGDFSLYATNNFKCLTGTLKAEHWSLTLQMQQISATDTGMTQDKKWKKNTMLTCFTSNIR